MCLAKDYTNQLLEIYNNIKADVHRLKEEVSIANQFNLDMLHTIENTNFNACEGYLLAKQIKDNQTFRRQAKCELETLRKLKDSFIDANMDLLSMISQEIINEDNRYKHNMEYKVYKPRVMGRKAPDAVVKKPVQPKPKFIPVPIPSQTLPITSKAHTVNTMSTTAIHKRSGEKIEIIGKIDNQHYFVKRKNGKTEILRTKNILNLELAQSAK